MAKVHTVEISNFEFDPDELAVEVGDSVKWVNRDAAMHDATRDVAPTFKTRLLAKDEESLEVVFEQATSSAGLEYFCSPHPFMTGKIIVALPGSNIASYTAQAAKAHRKKSE